MIARNLTSKSQNIKIRVYGESQVYITSLVPHGVTKLEKVEILNLEELKGLVEFEIPGNLSTRVVENTEEVGVKETTITEDTSEEVNNDNTVEGNTKPLEVVVPDKFVCDICGSEFASERGLVSHKNRAHKDE